MANADTAQNQAAKPAPGGTQSSGQIGPKMSGSGTIQFNTSGNIMFLYYTPLDGFRPMLEYSVDGGPPASLPEGETTVKNDGSVTVTYMGAGDAADFSLTWLY
ncbi:MAG TPA: hypothetical protein VFJ82_21740 [Longimicrobium sp.]|nr:hypothetical protein [Longimicrobium sp.]